MRRIAPVILTSLMCAVAACQLPVRAADEQPPQGTRQLRNIEFARPDGIPLHLDLFVPQSNQPVPLIIWVHGGGWYEGDRTDMQALPLLYAGYAVASVDYRLSQQAIFPAQIHDLKAAVRYLRANARQFGLDANHFGAWGESAGGHLVALLGATSVRGELEGDEGVTDVSSRVQAVADWYGPTDLLQRRAQTPKGSQNPDSPGSPDSRLLGGPAPRYREKAERANPITYVSKGVPPFFIVHGDRDSVVPLGQSTLLVEALRRVNAHVEFTVVEGGGHGDDRFFTDEMFARLRAFFDRYLKSGE